MFLSLNGPKSGEKWISGAKNFALDFLFPKFCALCGVEGEFLCAGCRAGLKPMAPSCFVCRKRDLSGKICPSCRKKTPLRRFFTVFSYKNAAVRELIYLYKYGRVRELAPVLAEFLIDELRFSGFAPRKGTAIIAVPLHPRKARERGFNQSELIAERVADALRVPVLKRALARNKNTPSQITLDSDEARRKNATGAFEVARPKEVSGKTIILVDDVVTSGSTLNEAARVLKEAGARSVWAMAVARR